MPGDIELLLRLLLACLLGGAVGLEREVSGQGAGFRTHILVALGACLFTVVSAYAFGPFVSGSGALRYDPTRIAAQVVSGVGFLGGGAILRSGTGIRGLTTAASLWVVAAIGLAAGAGAYGAAGVSTGATIASLWGLKRIRHQLRRSVRMNVEMTVAAGPELHLSQLLQRLTDRGVRVDRFRVDHEGELRTFTLAVQLPPGGVASAVVVDLAAIEGVRDVEWQR